MEGLQVRLDSFAHPEEIEAVRDVLAQAGLPADVQGGYEKARPGLEHGEGDEPEWLIVLLLTSTFGAFFTAFFGAAGTDSWRALKRFVKKLRDVRRRPTGPMIPPSPPHQGTLHIVDQHGNRIEESIYPSLPPSDFWKACELLSEPDWSQLGGWFVRWDKERGAWAAWSPTGARSVYWDREARQWREY